jgi:hypothetical protein
VICPHCDDDELKVVHKASHDKKCYDYVETHHLRQYSCVNCGGRSEVRITETSLIPIPILDRKRQFKVI